MELALERTRRLFDEFDDLYISFSGGKDSTAVLNVALQVAEEKNKLPLKVIFFDEEAIPLQTEDYLNRVKDDPRIKFFWYCLEFKHRNACSKKEPYWYCWDRTQKSKWVRPLPETAITKLKGFDRQPIPTINGLLFPKKDIKIAFLLGIRAQESIRRYQSVARKEIDNWISPCYESKNVFYCKPIYDWGLKDVWIAANKFRWDYNRSYDTMRMAGISLNNQRVCPPYGEEPLRALWMFSVCFPEIWDKMSVRVPGANTAANYSNSPLYSFGSKITFKDEKDAKDKIRKELKRWDKKTGYAILSRIKNEISLFSKKEGDKALPLHNADCGPSGVTWEFLFIIANRGDLKNRRQSSKNASNRFRKSTDK